MLWKLTAGSSLAALAALAVFPVPVHAQVYSPSQAELNSVEFVDFWPGNGATLDMKELVGPQGINPNPGVRYTFDTGYNPDAMPMEEYSRTQFETPAGVFTQDLSGYDSFDISFLGDFSSTFSQLQAQINLRYVGGDGFTSTNPINIGPDAQTRVSLPISAIPEASRTQITSFGVEIFAQNPFEGEVDSMVTAYTAPEFSETTLFSWETPDDPMTMEVDERFEGWEVGFHEPSLTTHSIYDDPDPEDGMGATDGSHALQIERTITTQEEWFRWGSQYVLAAPGGGGNPIGDYNDNGTVDAADYTSYRDAVGTMTALANDQIGGEIGPDHYDQWVNNFGAQGGSDPIQDEIDELVALLEDPATLSIAFDVTVDFHDTPPTFLSLELSISDSDGVEGTPDHFFQADAPALLANQTSVEEETTYTMEIPIGDFTDRTMGSPDMGQRLVDVGIYDNTNYLRLGLSSNLDSGFTYQIDNFRVRQVVNEGSGSLGAGGVPEPSTGLIGILLAGSLAVCRRRRSL